MKNSRNSVIGFGVFLIMSLTGCQKLAQIEDYREPAIQPGDESVIHDASFKAGRHGKAFIAAQTDCFSCHSKGKTDVLASNKELKLSCTPCHPGYPHEPGFDSVVLHSKAYADNPKECAVCHKDRGRIPPGAKNIPACSSCHGGYPHAEGFRAGEQHGNVYLQNPGTCSKCHGTGTGTDLGGRGRAVSCKTCHVTTHSENFKDTAEHGQNYLQSPSTCDGCHDQSQPGTAKRSCVICHQNFPHNSGFDEPATHGAAYFQNPADCAKCHGADFQGRGSAIGCNECHENFPHPGNWGLAERHGKAFVGNGKVRSTTCQGCHASSASISRTFPDHAVNCSTCHFWHLDPALRPSPPDGVNQHLFEARQAGNECLVCHKNFTALMPNYPNGGCKECHTVGKLEGKFRDPKVELQAVQPGTRYPQALWRGKPAEKVDYFWDSLWRWKAAGGATVF